MQISEELIHKCKKNERAAMAELFRLLAPTVKGICYRYSGNVSDAEDLLQETFITVFTKIHTFKMQGSFEGWVRRIAVNNSLNWLKKNKNVLQSYPMKPQYDIEEDQEEDSLVEEHQADLMKHIASLPDGYRTILNLFAIEGLSHKEIGEQLGINESTSRSQYTRAKRALQHLFAKEKEQ